MRVALFIICFNATLFPETGRAVVDLLERLRDEVEFPEEQTCCGQRLVKSSTGSAERAYSRSLRSSPACADRLRAVEE